MNNNLRGKLGFKGERGYSAYEIAVQNGYTGTEAQWADSFLNADNYYNKSEVNAIAAGIKSDFAVVTGTFDDASGHVSVDYPTGFNKDNCVIISATWGYYQQTLHKNDNNDPYVVLMDTNIRWYDGVAHSSSSGDYDFNIVLMKIGE